MDQQRSDAYSDPTFYFDADLDPDPTLKVVQAKNGIKILRAFLGLSAKLLM